MITTAAARNSAKKLAEELYSPSDRIAQSSSGIGGKTRRATLKDDNSEIRNYTMTSFSDLMHRKPRLEFETECQKRARGLLEHRWRQVEDTLSDRRSEIQVLERRIQTLKEEELHLENEFRQIEMAHTDGTAVLITLRREHEALVAFVHKSLHECIQQTVACPACGRRPENLKWTWIESFKPKQKSGWRAACPDCQVDVAFFEVD